MVYQEQMSFAEIQCINQAVLEITPHRGIEINRRHIWELSNYLQQQDLHIGILFNRHYGFSFAFEVLQRILDTPRVTSIAFLVRDSYSYSNTENDLQLVLQPHKPMEIFYDKRIALLWFNMLRTRLPHEHELFVESGFEPKPPRPVLSDT